MTVYLSGLPLPLVCRLAYLAGKPIPIVCVPAVQLLRPCWVNGPPRCRPLLYSEVTAALVDRSDDEKPLPTAAQKAMRSKYAAHCGCTPQLHGFHSALHNQCSSPEFIAKPPSLVRLQIDSRNLGMRKKRTPSTSTCRPLLQPHHPRKGARISHVSKMAPAAENVVTVSPAFFKVFGPIAVNVEQLIATASVIQRPGGWK